MVKLYLTEAIGTLFLVLTIGLTGNPVAVGGMLMVMVYMGRHVSGAYYNPAVCLAACIAGKLDRSKVVRYWIAQLAGAVVAGIVFRAMTGGSFSVVPGERLLPALLAEFFFTFALALVVLNVATSKRTEGNSYFGIAIGFTVTAGAFAVGNISGGAFNPAVGLGANLVHSMFGGDSLVQSWIYLVAPFLGAAVAASLFRVQEGE